MGRWLSGACAGLALSCAAVLSACLLTTSLDDLSAGPTGRTSPEASTGSEGSTAETGTGSDGGADGSTEHFCASLKPAPSFCDDFDDAGFPAPFTPVTDNGGTVVRVEDDVRSPLHAVLFTVLGGSEIKGAGLTYPIPSLTKDLVIRFEAKVESLGTSDDYDIFQVSGGGAAIGFQVNQDRSLSWDEDYADAAKTGSEVAMGKVLPVGWAALELSVHVEGASALAELRVDGALFGSRTFEASALAASKPIAIFGDTYMSGPIGDYRARIDNVVVDAR